MKNLMKPDNKVVFSGLISLELHLEVIIGLESIDININFLDSFDDIAIPHRYFRRVNSLLTDECLTTTPLAQMVQKSIFFLAILVLVVHESIPVVFLTF